MDIIGNINIYNDDCLNVFLNMDSESIDLIVTDPPYKLTSRGSSGTMGGYWKNDSAKKGKIFSNNSILCSEYMPEFYRLLKNGSICYVMCNNSNLYNFLKSGIDSGFNFVKSIIWEKGNKICGTYYMGCYEYILLFRKGSHRPINNCGTPDILKIPVSKTKDHNSKNLHDTEKPVKLMKILIENSSNINDIVLDPFMGIGSTGIACLESNRNFFGIEIDNNFFDIAKERIYTNNIFSEQTSLF